MALVVTIAGEDRTSIIETDTIRINQVADSFTFTASLSLFDEDGDIDITAGSHLDADKITIVDGATTYFGGYVVNRDIEAAEEDSRHLHLQCQGFGIRANEALVEYEEYASKADDWIINDLFSTYLPFDSVTHVAQIDAAMDISFTEMTLAECMEAICARTKGRWYIDNSKKVHYFAAESSGPGWFLSNTPEAATENLVVNPSFEVNVTDGWTDANWESFTRSDTHSKFGSYAARLYDSALAGNETFLSDFMAVDPSSDYTLSLWMKKQNCTGTGRIRIYWYTALDAHISTVEQVLDAGEHDWKRYTLTAESPATAAKAIVRPLHISGITIPSLLRIYIDGVQFEKKSAATTCCIGGRAGCDWSNGDHNSTSDRIISYSYHAQPEKKVDAAAIVNRVRVIGADDFAVTRNDATSQAAYGIRAGYVTDQSLETTAAMEERGDDVLDKNKDPRTTYTVKTFQDGAVAGMDIGFRCPQLDIDTEQVIRELNITWWMNEPRYELALGTHAETAAISRAFYTGDAIRKIIVSPSIPLASRGWSHDLAFSATDHDTVAWAAGTITLAGGVGSFAIAPGANTGNMAATTYIYLDTAISLTALQTDVSAANAVGANKILIAVAKNVAAGKLAIFQVFGGEGGGQLVDTDNIAVQAVDTAELALLAVETAQLGNEAVTTGKILARTILAGDIAALTITAGEIAANTITAGQILANTITAAEIAAGTITTNEILANTILAGDIAADTITGNEIAANAIEAAHINVATLSAINANMGTLTAGEIRMYTGTWDADADGFRITTAEIACQTDGVDQFIIVAATGKATCGAGEVVLDETGIIVAEVVKMDAGGMDIAITTTAADIRAYKFELSDVVMSGLFAYAADANSHVINLVAKEIAGRSPTVGIYADSPSTTPAYISVKADSAGDFAQVLLTADSDAAVKTKANINAARTEFSGIISTDASVNRWKLKGVGAGTYVGWVGYVEVEINGTTYKLTYGTWT